MRSVALIVLALACCARSTDAPDLVPVTRGDLVIGVEVTGELAAVDSVDMMAPALLDLMVFKLAWLAPEGSEVAAGAPVIKFDADELERKLEMLRGQADEARARLEQTILGEALGRGQQELALVKREVATRKAALTVDVPADLVPAMKLRADRLEAEQAEAELAQARRATDHARRDSDARIRSATDARERALREIDQIERALPGLTVAAPRAGTVVYPGRGDDRKKAGDSVYVSETLLQVVRLDAMAGNGQIDEVDLARVAVGKPVALRLDALPDLALSGAVESIAASVQHSAADPSNIVRLTIAIRPVRGAGLRPGMRFRGQVEVARLADVTLVPADAVFVTEDGPVAYRNAGGGLEPVQLELGQRSSEMIASPTSGGVRSNAERCGGMIEVRRGLAPGDRVSRSEPEREAP